MSATTPEKFTAADAGDQLTISPTNDNVCIYVETKTYLLDYDVTAEAIIRLFKWEVVELAEYLNKWLEENQPTPWLNTQTTTS